MTSNDRDNDLKLDLSTPRRNLKHYTSCLPNRPRAVNTSKLRKPGHTTGFRVSKPNISNSNAVLLANLNNGHPTRTKRIDNVYEDSTKTLEWMSSLINRAKNVLTTLKDEEINNLLEEEEDNKNEYGTDTSYMAFNDTIKDNIVDEGSTHEIEEEDEDDLFGKSEPEPEVNEAEVIQEEASDGSLIILSDEEEEQSYATYSSEVQQEAYLSSDDDEDEELEEDDDEEEEESTPEEEATLNIQHDKYEEQLDNDHEIVTIDRENKHITGIMQMEDKNISNDSILEEYTPIQNLNEVQPDNIEIEANDSGSDYIDSENSDAEEGTNANIDFSRFMQQRYPSVNNILSSIPKTEHISNETEYNEDVHEELSQEYLDEAALNPNIHSPKFDETNAFTRFNENQALHYDNQISKIDEYVSEMEQTEEQHEPNNTHIEIHELSSSDDNLSKSKTVSEQEDQEMTPIESSVEDEEGSTQSIQVGEEDYSNGNIATENYEIPILDYMSIANEVVSNIHDIDDTYMHDDIAPIDQSMNDHDIEDVVKEVNQDNGLLKHILSKTLEGTAGNTCDTGISSLNMNSIYLSVDEDNEKLVQDKALESTLELLEIKSKYEVLISESVYSASSLDDNSEILPPSVEYASPFGSDPFSSHTQTPEAQELLKTTLKTLSLQREAPQEMESDSKNNPIIITASNFDELNYEPNSSHSDNYMDDMGEEAILPTTERLPNDINKVLKSINPDITDKCLQIINEDSVQEKVGTNGVPNEENEEVIEEQNSDVFVNTDNTKFEVNYHEVVENDTDVYLTENQKKIPFKDEDIEIPSELKDNEKMQDVVEGNSTIYFETNTELEGDLNDIKEDLSESHKSQEVFETEVHEIEIRNDSTDNSYDEAEIKQGTDDLLNILAAAAEHEQELYQEAESDTKLEKNSDKENNGEYEKNISQFIQQVSRHTSDIPEENDSDKLKDDLPILEHLPDGDTNIEDKAEPEIEIEDTNDDSSSHEEEGNNSVRPDNQETGIVSQNKDNDIIDVQSIIDTDDDQLIEVGVDSEGEDNLVTAIEGNSSDFELHSNGLDINQILPDVSIQSDDNLSDMESRNVSPAIPNISNNIHVSDNVSAIIGNEDYPTPIQSPPHTESNLHHSDNNESIDLIRAISTVQPGVEEVHVSTELHEVEEVHVTLEQHDVGETQMEIENEIRTKDLQDNENNTDTTMHNGDSGEEIDDINPGFQDVPINTHYSEDTRVNRAEISVLLAPPTFSRRILASPIRVFGSIASGFKNVRALAQNFVHTIDVLDSDDSESSEQSDALEEINSSTTSEIEGSVNKPVSANQSDVETPKSENDLKGNRMIVDSIRSLGMLADTIQVLPNNTFHINEENSGEEKEDTENSTIEPVQEYMKSELDMYMVDSLADHEAQHVSNNITNKEISPSVMKKYGDIIEKVIAENEFNDIISDISIKDIDSSDYEYKNTPSSDLNSDPPSDHQNDHYDDDQEVQFHDSLDSLPNIDKEIGIETSESQFNELNESLSSNSQESLYIKRNESNQEIEESLQPDADLQSEDDELLNETEIENTVDEIIQVPEPIKVHSSGNEVLEEQQHVVSKTFVADIGDETVELDTDGPEIIVEQSEILGPEALEFETTKSVSIQPDISEGKQNQEEFNAIEPTVMNVPEKTEKPKSPKKNKNKQRNRNFRKRKISIVDPPSSEVGNKRMRRGGLGKNKNRRLLRKRD